jgi:hypothetical protein
MLKLGIDMALWTVVKYMIRQRRMPSPAQLTFLRNQTARIARSIRPSFFLSGSDD